MTGRRECGRCRSTGDVKAALQLIEPVSERTSALVRMMASADPNSIRQWLASSEDILAVLRETLGEHRPLRHDDFDRIERPIAVRNFRRRLEVAGLLPERHFELGLFDTWTGQFLQTIERDDDRQTITAYMRWSQRRRLEQAIENGTIRDGSFRVARRYIRMATTFLAWLHDDQGRDLDACRQRNIDSWFANGNSNRWSAISFLDWAKSQRLLDRSIQLPVPQPPVANGMPTSQRTEIVQRLLHDNTISIDERVAGLFVVVYAQPVSRICRMRSNAVAVTAEGIAVMLGKTQIELPEVVARLLRRHLVEHPPDCHGWLFPGGVAGRPVSSTGLSERLRPHGVTKHARVSALHDLTRKIPSSVLSDMIGYNPFVVATRAEKLGAPWQHYAALLSVASGRTATSQ